MGLGAQELQGQPLFTSRPRCGGSSELERRRQTAVNRDQFTVDRSQPQVTGDDDGYVQESKFEW